MAGDASRAAAAGAAVPAPRGQAPAAAGASDSFDRSRGTGAVGAGYVVNAAMTGGNAAGGVIRGGASDTGSWRPHLLPLLSDSRAGVRVNAIEAAGYWLPDAGLGAALAERAGTAAAPPEERALALVALARGERAARPAASGATAPPAPAAVPAVPPALASLLAAAAGAPVPRLRASAAQAAALLGDGALLRRLGADPSPVVREAVLTAALAGPGAARAAAAGLTDRDEGVRITACAWLADHPVVPLAGLKVALITALRDESIESPLGAIRAVTARAEAQPLERGALVELLEEMAKQPSHVLRREAALALVRLGRPALPPGPAAGGQAGDLADNLDLYREIVQRTRRQRTVEVRTSRGSFRLRLDCAQAPRTCLNFLELAGQHFYDSLTFHRVVPNFVVQAGDPRGDGFGGPGYTVRDELNRLRYRRGVIGMALAGADTGGSQFFITLSEQPHLDGGYTAFGEVISGMEVLDAIEAGDRIASIAEIR
jgi:cyclophilin family peptidyl-prolyl cis-trans isomerase